jgi:hypothetical protein
LKFEVGLTHREMKHLGQSRWELFVEVDQPAPAPLPQTPYEFARWKQTQDLLEILNDRYGRAATLVATQIPIQDWHACIPAPTLADSVLDRLIHNAYRIELKGDSMRKIHSPLKNDDT